MKKEIYCDGLILDIDGTIWNTTGIVADAWNFAIQKNNFKVQAVTSDLLKNEFGKPMNIIAKDLFPDLSENDQNFLMDECCKYEQEYLNKNSIDITYPGVIETIKALSTKTKLFIVSNCQDGYIELLLDKINIKNYIGDFECFGHSGLQKNENIKLICQRNNLLHPVYIGDTNGDAQECKKANVPFVWASYGFGNVEENNYYKKIFYFTELLNIFNFL